MDTQTVQLISAVAVPVVAVGVWLLRLEGRLNTHDVQYDALKDDLRYIRDRIDKALNGHDER